MTDIGIQVDTVQFSKVTDTAPCYLPWCVDDFGPDHAEAYAGRVHIHRGATKKIELKCIERGHEYPEGTEYVEAAYVRLHRFDDDDRDTPTTGETYLILEVTGEGTQMTPADAVRLAELLIEQARIAQPDVTSAVDLDRVPPVSDRTRADDIMVFYGHGLDDGTRIARKVIADALADLPDRYYEGYADGLATGFGAVSRWSWRFGKGRRIRRGIRKSGLLGRLS